MGNNTVPLTNAQRARLAALLQAHAIAQEQLNGFASYLRDEHQLPAGNWSLQPDRFVLEDDPTEDDDSTE